MIQEYTASSQPPKLLDQVRERLRVKHYSIRTEQAYVDWIKRFIWFHGKRHPKSGLIIRGRGDLILTT